MLRVPGNQGNWWHALVGAPFFLAYPMIGLRARALLARRPLPAMASRLIWSAVVLSIGGTIAVEVPFLLHLAGTSDWQRFLVLGSGLGIVLCSAVILVVRRRVVAPLAGCIAGLDTAYLANAALCLIVYSEATGSLWSRAGWVVSAVIVWPIAAELILVLGGAVQGRTRTGAQAP